jgi:hypothetical protein
MSDVSWDEYGLVVTASLPTGTAEDEVAQLLADALPTLDRRLWVEVSFVAGPALTDHGRPGAAGHFYGVLRAERATSSLDEQAIGPMIQRAWQDALSAAFGQTAMLGAVLPIDLQTLAKELDDAGPARRTTGF